MKKKLNITDLKVKSFVTESKTADIKGGADNTAFPCGVYFRTEPKTCVESVNWCWTP
ncbi:MAG: pinensin family lanthipeptide [Cyclobacteriaceae bacterium]